MVRLNPSPEGLHRIREIGHPGLCRRRRSGGDFPIERSEAKQQREKTHGAGGGRRRGEGREGEGEEGVAAFAAS